MNKEQRENQSLSFADYELALLAVASYVLIAHTQHKQLRYSVDKNYKENQLHSRLRGSVFTVYLLLQQ